MKLRGCVVLLLTLFAFTHTLQAQETTVFTEANLAYKRGMDFYNKGLFALSQEEFKIALTQLRPIPEPEARLLRGQAELYYAKAAVRSAQPNGEQLMLDYIRAYTPDPLATQAALEMGDFYFNQNKLDKALAFYESVPSSSVSAAQREELSFKKGYALFVQKKFSPAKAEFLKAKDNNDGKYYEESNYYYAMCAFFENKLEDAQRHFMRVKNSKKYAATVPYHIVQIYAAQKDYDNVLKAGQQALETPNIRNIPQINQLLGQAYFEKKDYVNAEKFLNAGSEGQMREEDFYQLGFCQHRAGKYAQAAPNLENLNRANSKLGQHAMYLLGDCYIRLGDRSRAKNAFATAVRLKHDPSISEDAQWNYAKLCYELKQTQEAVDALQLIPQGSKYYNEAQSLLGDVLLRSADYEEAINVIGRTTNKTPKLRESLQKATVYRGIQLYQGGDMNGAKSYFERSLSDAPDLQTRAIANYWLGDIAHQQKEYAASQRYIGTFLTLAKTTSGLPDESSVHTGNYIQGYNFLKEKNYQTALGYFQDCVNGIKREQQQLYSDYVKNNVLGDATLRAGDCLFKRNRYDEALRYYNEAIDRRYSGYVYALYQKGILQGLKGDSYGKILSLEKLANEYPNSEFAAASLLEAGATYQNLNKLNEAETILLKLVANYKSKNDMVNAALLRLGLISQNRGNNEKAISYYKQVFYNNPSTTDSKAALERLEDIYTNDLGKPDEYFAFLQTIPGYRIDNIKQDSISFRSADVQFESGNYDRAISGYTSYLAKFPNGTNAIQAYYNRGECYGIKKDYDNALIDYESVVMKGASKLYFKAVEKAALLAYNHKKDFTKALDLYLKMEKAAESDDKRFDAEIGAMRSAYRLNKTDIVYEMAGKVANNNLAKRDQIATASFYQGKIAYDRKDYTTAQTALKKAITNGGNDEQTFEARYLDAMIDYNKRNLDIALDKADRASQNNPFAYWAAKCLILQADIYAEKNDLFSARAALEAVIDGTKDYPDLQNEAKQKLANLEKKEKTNSKINNNLNNNILEMDRN